MDGEPEKTDIYINTRVLEDVTYFGRCQKK